MLAYIGIGSNLGDRQANILAALQFLRTRVRVDAVSSFYEAPPFEDAKGPAFLNVAAQVETSLSREAFARACDDAQAAVGRRSQTRLEARAIDIDILAFDGEIHSELESRPYNSVPLAEIAPVFERFARGNAHAVRRLARSLHFRNDRQNEMPEVPVSLNRVGVRGVRRIVQLEIDGSTRLYDAQFSMVADLAPEKAGVHMSRFVEILEEATLDVLAANAPPTGVEGLAETIARQIVRSQHAVRADVRVRADFGLERWTPVSAKRGEEIYTLVGIAHADSDAAIAVVGVEAEGMTACPCAQLMVREHSIKQLLDAGFDDAQAQRAIDALPVATHNQRGRGALLVGLPPGAGRAVKIADLVEIVENSMSSETYNLLKRPDEFFIVNKAHQNPKFVEDVVRGMLSRTLDMYSDVRDDAFVFASQVNYESIHKHDAFAEAFGTFGEFRAELESGARVVDKTDLATWLGTRASAVLSPA